MIKNVFYCAQEAKVIVSLAVSRSSTGKVKISLERLKSRAEFSIEAVIRCKRLIIPLL